jgi:diaminohydroxyphosphoribosylaminopyrimidine deaminase/5-amino-6-(5-phosphoribosylamino)uracil reductase
MNDIKWMKLALKEARKGLGRTGENPSVGAVLVRDGVKLAVAATGRGGRPHAEAQAVAKVDITQLAGASLYVTLEPCCHHGHTSPCVEAVIAAGIRRVVVAIRDPDRRVAGQGIAQLQHAGIEVVEGVCATEARELHAGFLLHRTEQRPLVSIKIATSLDGKIAAANGHSQWITSKEARHYVQLMRAAHDAILIGSGTLLADDPQLLCRIPRLLRDTPIRVVLDSRLQILPSHRLVTTIDKAPLIVCTLASTITAHSSKVEALQRQGVMILGLPSDRHGHVDIKAVLGALAEQGITRLMVEGGEKVIAALLAAGLVDRLEWLRAPIIIGAEGIPAVGNLGLERVDAAVRWHCSKRRLLGPDLLEIYTRHPLTC